MYEGARVGGQSGIYDGEKYRYMIQARLVTIEGYYLGILERVAVYKRKIGGDEGSGPFLSDGIFEDASDGKLTL